MANSDDVFVGDYNLVRSDKFGEFLSALGVGYLLRKVAVNTKPTFHVKKEGDNEYTFLSKSTFKNSETKFKLDEEFEEKRMDGVTCKSVISRDGNKLIQKQESDPPAEIIREFNGDELKIICRTKDKKDGKDVEAIRVYKRVTK